MTIMSSDPIGTWVISWTGPLDKGLENNVGFWNYNMEITINEDTSESVEEYAFLLEVLE